MVRWKCILVLLTELKYNLYEIIWATILFNNYILYMNDMNGNIDDIENKKEKL